MDREQILAILSAWGLDREKVGQIQAVMDVYKVETALGPMNLKWTRHPDDKLSFILSALRHLAERGFKSFREPIPTGDGQPFLVRDGQHYLLSAWIEGRQADLADPAQLAAACQTLARFHSAAKGFKAPPGLNIRVRWGQILKALAKRRGELSGLPQRVSSRPCLTGFDREVQQEIAHYLSLASFAHQLLANSSYRDLSAQAAAEGCLCHGDVAARNFILAPAGEVCLIDFDGLCQDLPLMDLWKLFRRAMKAFRWDIDLGTRIIEAYERILPLSPQELQVLLALISFPEKFWRLINRYYGGRHVVDEVKFHRKLRKYTEQRQAHAAFVAHLAEFCRRRGVASDWSSWPLDAEKMVL